MAELPSAKPDAPIDLYGQPNIEKILTVLSEAPRDSAAIFVLVPEEFEPNVHRVFIGPPNDRRLRSTREAQEWGLALLQDLTGVTPRLTPDPIVDASGYRPPQFEYTEVLGYRDVTTTTTAGPMVTIKPERLEEKGVPLEGNSQITECRLVYGELVQIDVYPTEEAAFEVAKARLKASRQYSGLASSK